MDGMSIVLLILLILGGIYVLRSAIIWTRDGTPNLIPLIITLILLVMTFGGNKFSGPEWIQDGIEMIDNQIDNLQDWSNIKVSKNGKYFLFGLVYLALSSLVIGMVTQNRASIISARHLLGAGVILSVLSSVVTPNIDWDRLGKEMNFESSFDFFSTDEVDKRTDSETREGWSGHETLGDSQKELTKKEVTDRRARQELLGDHENGNRLDSSSDTAGKREPPRRYSTDYIKKASKKGPNP